MSLNDFKTDLLEVAANPPIKLISGGFWSLEGGELCGCPVTNLAIDKGWLTEETLRRYFESHPTFEGNAYMDGCKKFIAKQYNLDVDVVADFISTFDRITRGHSATLSGVVLTLKALKW